MEERQFDAVVLGAGVLGLSIAVELVKRGRKVAVVARDLPEDLDSTEFASPWAGANWASYATNERERTWDIRGFHYFEQLSQTHPEIVKLTNVTYTYQEPDEYIEPWYSTLVKNYRHLSGDEIPGGFKYAYGFQNFCLDPPAYTAHLCGILRSHDVPIIRKRLSSLDEAYTVCGPVDLVINATGLGARGLLGVNDDTVFPARGQSVLVKAPNVDFCRSTKIKTRLQATGVQTVIITRPGPHGHVFLGTTFEKDNYSTLPDPESAKRILQDCYALCPELSGGKGWEAIEVISHNVGLRPCRQGGARVELEQRKIGDGAEGMTPTVKGTGRGVGVVHAYGIGAAGYQASHGIGIEAADLAEEYLRGKME